MEYNWFTMKYIIIWSLLTYLFAGLLADSLQHPYHKHTALFSNETLPDSIGYERTTRLQDTHYRIDSGIPGNSYLPSESSRGKLQKVPSLAAGGRNPKGKFNKTRLKEQRNQRSESQLIDARKRLSMFQRKNISAYKIFETVTDKIPRTVRRKRNPTRRMAKAVSEKRKMIQQRIASSNNAMKVTLDSTRAFRQPRTTSKKTPRTTLVSGYLPQMMTPLDFVSVTNKPKTFRQKGTASDKTSNSALNTGDIPRTATLSKVLPTTRKFFQPRTTFHRATSSALNTGDIPRTATLPKVLPTTYTTRTFEQPRTTFDRATSSALNNEDIPRTATLSKVLPTTYTTRAFVQPRTTSDKATGTTFNREDLLKTDTPSNHLSTRARDSASLVFLRTKTPSASRVPVAVMENVKPPRMTVARIYLDSRINVKAKKANIGQGMIHSSRGIGIDKFSLKEAKQSKLVHRTTTNEPDAMTKRESSISRTRTEATSGVTGQGIANPKHKYRHDKSLREIKQTRSVLGTITKSRRSVPRTVTESHTSRPNIGHGITNSNHEHGNEKSILKDVKQSQPVHGSITKRRRPVLRTVAESRVGDIGHGITNSNHGHGNEKSTLKEVKQSQSVHGSITKRRRPIPRTMMESHTSRPNIGHGITNFNHGHGNEKSTLKEVKQSQSVHGNVTKRRRPVPRTVMESESHTSKPNIGHGITNSNHGHGNEKSTLKEVKQSQSVYGIIPKRRRPVLRNVAESRVDDRPIGHGITNSKRRHGSEKHSSLINNQPKSVHGIKDNPDAKANRSKKSTSKSSRDAIIRFPPRGKRMSKPVKSREKRYMYDTDEDWEYEYDYDDKTDIEKFLDDWHRDGLRTLGFLTVGCCIFFTCCCACQTAIRSCCNSCSANCKACGDKVRCRDPTYRKFCKAAGPLGLKMSYSDYKKLKKNYTEYAKQKYGQEAPRII